MGQGSIIGYEINEKTCQISFYNDKEIDEAWHLGMDWASQKRSDVYISNPGKVLAIGNWKSVAIAGTGWQAMVFMLPRDGDLMLGWNPNTKEKRDILMPKDVWGYPQELKAFYSSDGVTPSVLGVVVVADKAVSKITVDTTVVSFGVTLTDVKGYPGKADNFVTCYNIYGDWHDKYAIVGTNGTYNGAYQIPMGDLLTVSQRV